MDELIEYANRNADILEPTDDALENRQGGNCFKSSVVIITEEHINALQDAKMLVWDDNEYWQIMLLESNDANT